MSKKLPNFMIAGMAKCGTSSLADYLKQHPDVFISKKKEPRYFTSQDEKIYPLNGPKDDAVMDWYVPEFENYTSLFEEANCKAIGEASADTLYFHEQTIPRIKDVLGDPKIIIILREPVKRAFSAFQHLKRDEREALGFEEALHVEHERVENNWELIYHYKQVSLYHDHVKAFLDNFSQVKIVFNDDLSKNPDKVLKECFDFLEVDNEFKVDTSLRLNPSGLPKSRFLHEFLWKESILRKMARPFVRLVFRQKSMRKKITTQLMTKNLDRMEINPKTKNELKEFFKDDIMKTSQLTGKDLSHWMN